MTISFDESFGIHEKALALRAKRTEVLASNLANADTPNFKAKDFDFKEALRAATESTSSNPQTANVKHLSLLTDASAVDAVKLKFRNPISPSADGNTVEVQKEQAEFAENALQYQVSLSFLSSRIQNMMSAIKGE